MLLMFLALFFLLGAVSTAAAAGLLPALRPGRPQAAWLRIQRRLPQTPPGDTPWRGSPDFQPSSFL
jgi:hypothetical protein